MYKEFVSELKIVIPGGHLQNAINESFKEIDISDADISHRENVCIFNHKRKHQQESVYPYFPTKSSFQIQNILPNSNTDFSSEIHDTSDHKFCFNFS